MPGNEIAVVVPVFREARNIPHLVDELGEALAGRDWEVVFVDDDSNDGTADLVRQIARENNRVRLVLRVHERGLSTAAIAGMLSAKADVLVVMDGDGQHDPKIIPDLVQPLTDNTADIVSAARQFDQIGDGELSPNRRRLSALANDLAGWLVGRRIGDPMTGFFAISAKAFDGVVRNLGDAGFKLLLDLLRHGPQLRHQEIAFRFRPRGAGETKLDNANLWLFFTYLLAWFSGGILPPRFISFILIGGTGVAVHLSVLYPTLWYGFSFAGAQLIAALVATAWNYSLNNMLTFRDRQLEGSAFVLGFLKYLLTASVGLAANVAVAQSVHDDLTGLVFVSAMAGIMIDTVWKYVVAGRLVWRKQ